LPIFRRARGARADRCRSRIEASQAAASAAIEGRDTSQVSQDIPRALEKRRKPSGGRSGRVRGGSGRRPRAVSRCFDHFDRWRVWSFKIFKTSPWRRFEDFDQIRPQASDFGPRGRLSTPSCSNVKLVGKRRGAPPPDRSVKDFRLSTTTFGPNLVGAHLALSLAVRVGCPLAGELHVRWQCRSPLTDAAQERLLYIDALRCAARRRGPLSPFLRSARWRNLLGNTCAWLVWDTLGLGTSEERVQIDATPDSADRLHSVLSLARCEPDGITAFVLPCRGCGSGHLSRRVAHA
jgi:hypothetical protein